MLQAIATTSASGVSETGTRAALTAKAVVLRSQGAGMLTGVTTMSNPIQHVGCYYLREGIVNHRKVVQKAVRVLAQHKTEFDVLVGTGVSGLLLLTTLAYLLRMRFVVVRKADDTSGHSTAKIEGSLRAGDRWLFLDDFVSSGATKKHCLETLRATAKANNIRPLPKLVAQYRYLCKDGKYSLLNPKGGLKLK